MELKNFKLTQKNREKMIGWLESEHIKRSFDEPKLFLDRESEHKEKFSFMKSFLVVTDTVNSNDVLLGYCYYTPFSLWNYVDEFHGDKEGIYLAEGFIGEDTYLNQAYGKQMTLMLMQELLSKKDLKKMIVFITQDNEVAARTLLATGFQKAQDGEYYFIDKDEMKKQVVVLDEMAYGSVLSYFMCLFMAIGMLLGSLYDNMTIGMLFGISIGTLIGSGIDEKKRKARSMIFPTRQTMEITSPTITEGGLIPERHVAKGENLSPELHIAKIPEGTVTLAVIMDDIEHPIDGILNHWVIWNIPVTSVIPEGIPAGEKVTVLENAIQGKGYGKNAYKGPNPKGSSLQRYRFHVFALDDNLKVPLPAGKFELMTSMKGHIIGYGNLTAKYGIE